MVLRFRLADKWEARVDRVIEVKRVKEVLFRPCGARLFVTGSLTACAPSTSSGQALGCILTPLRGEGVGEKEDCEAGESAPEVHDGMQPGLEESDGDQDEAYDGSQLSQRGAQGESSDICGTAAAAEIDVGGEGDEPGEDHSGEGGADQVAERVF